MREWGKTGPILSILVVAGLVMVTDIILMPTLLETYHQPSESSIYFIANDLSVTLFTGLAGLFVAPRVCCPIWWQSKRNSEPWRGTALLTAVGVSIVIVNTLNNLISVEQSMRYSPWLSLLTPPTALAVSFRAALNEEVIFRLFLFPLAAWVFKRLKQTEISLIIGALTSSILFGLIHGAGFLWASLTGLALVYIYYQRGLLPAMSIHFFADAIPFVLISMAP